MIRVSRPVREVEVRNVERLRGLACLPFRYCFHVPRKIHLRISGGVVRLPAVAKCGGPETLFDWHGFAKSDDKSSGGDQEEEKPLESDRPGFGDCPSVVGCDRCQLEIGYTYSYDREGNTSQIVHTYPESLLRVGALANWFELRVSWSQEQDTDRVFGVSSHTDVGSQDMNVGFKIAPHAAGPMVAENGVGGGCHAADRFTCVHERQIPTGSGIHL